VQGDYYEKYWSAEGFNPEGGLGPETRRMLAALLGAGRRIVDVGCGDGAGLGRWCQMHGVDYLGLDVSTTALEKARQIGLDTQKIEDAADLPMPSASEAAMACFEVFEHLVDPADAAVEIHRVLEPGGILIATVPNAAYWVRRGELGILGRFNPYGDALSRQAPWRDPHVRFFTRTSIASMLRVAGFDSVTVTAEGHPVFSLRTRIESSPPYLFAMRRLPGLLAPTLLAVARRRSLQ
jgi:ubiquinone/menaquinone biosynthesis C-methylase UbiE